MNEKYNPTREQYIKIASKYLGMKEGSQAFKNFIDIYNTIQKTYKMTYTAPWCACFVSFINIDSGGFRHSRSFPNAISCDDMFSKFIVKGRYVDALKNPVFIPQQGDTVFYNLDNNKATAEHVGIVYDVTIGTNPIITVIEGNKSDKVATRTLKKDNAKIKGYGLPRFR